jgi:hypothetical protein
VARYVPIAARAILGAGAPSTKVGGKEPNFGGANREVLAVVGDARVALAEELQGVVEVAGLQPLVGAVRAVNAGPRQLMHLVVVDVKVIGVFICSSSSSGS